MSDRTRVQRYAELVVRVGLNVQPAVKGKGSQVVERFVDADRNRLKDIDDKDDALEDAFKTFRDDWKAKYGKEFYTEIGHKGGRATREKYGPEFYGEIGKKGGQSTAEKHGPEFYEKIGKKGGQRVRELIERGKQSDT